MTYEEFYKEQYPVLLKAEEQLKNLITQFETNENKKKIAYCSSRIKSPESMKQKLLKKGEEPNAENAVSKVNDAVGVRVITSFVDDIYKVADLIEKQQDIHILKICFVISCFYVIMQTILQRINQPWLQYLKKRCC